MSDEFYLAIYYIVNSHLWATRYGDPKAAQAERDKSIDLWGGLTHTEKVKLARIKAVLFEEEGE